MGRSRTAPLLVTGVTVIAGALLVVATPGSTIRSGQREPAAAPVSRVHPPRSAALHTPAPASSPVPTTTAARGPGYLLGPSGEPVPTGPAEWPPRRFEPPETPQGNPLYALPRAQATAVWSPPKSTGPPAPAPEGGWSAAAVAPAAVAVASKAAVVVPAVRAAQAIPPAAAPGTQDPGSNGYLVVGSVLLLAGGGLIVLARGIEAARPRRRRRGTHRRIA
jgi:hypothetical protein